MLLRYREYSFELRTPERKDEKKRKPFERDLRSYLANEFLEPNVAAMVLRSDRGGNVLFGQRL